MKLWADSVDTEVYKKQTLSVVTVSDTVTKAPDDSVGLQGLVHSDSSVFIIVMAMDIFLDFFVSWSICFSVVQLNEL